MIFGTADKTVIDVYAPNKPIDKYQHKQNRNNVIHRAITSLFSTFVWE